MRPRPLIAVCLVSVVGSLFMAAPVAIDSAHATRRAMPHMPAPMRSPRAPEHDSDAPEAEQRSVPVRITNPSKGPETDSATAKKNDVYQKRATEKLEADQSVAAASPHPLAAQYPDHYVTVCLAGCIGDRVRIAGMIGRVAASATASGTQPDVAAATTVYTRGQVVPTAAENAKPATAEEGTATNDVAQKAPQGTQPLSAACVAGCYGIQPLGAPQRAATAPAATDSRWLTTSTTAPTASGAPAKWRHRSRPAPSPSGEWFSRINRDRAR